MKSKFAIILCFILLLTSVYFVLTQNNGPTGYAVGIAEPQPPMPTAFHDEELPDSFDDKIKWVERPDLDPMGVQNYLLNKKEYSIEHLEIFEYKNFEPQITLYACRAKVSENKKEKTDSINFKELSYYSQILQKDPNASIYASIQDAIDAGEASPRDFVKIIICPDTYHEDLTIQSTKNYLLDGLGAGPIIEGSGNGYSAFRVQDKCPNDDNNYCFGTVELNNIHFRHPTTPTSKPTVAIYVEYNNWCEFGTCHVDRLKLIYKNGHISGFSSGISLAGGIDLVVDQATIFDNNGAINLKVDAMEIQLAGTGEYNIEDYIWSPVAVIKNSNIYNHAITGIYANNSIIHMDNVEMYDNSNMATFWLEYGSIGSIKNSLFRNNTTSFVIKLDNYTNLDIDNTTIRDNASSWKGTSLAGGHTVSIVNSHVQNNTAAQGTGGAWVSNSTDFTSQSTCWNGNTLGDVYHNDTQLDYIFGCNTFVCDASGCY
ncbi:hypothetical protein BVY03_02080 [bacterium K02(2017)]|nr:hypothetical protein BVY03_02080 [bacterium K02(2017)]